MADAVPTRVPYRPGVQPMDAAHPDFTNPDPRLRPQWPIAADPSDPHGYRITPQAFPQLHARYTAMMREAGLPAYPLYVTDRVSPFAARFIRESKQIWLNRSLFNQLSFDEITTMLVGHEIGHAWRMQNPEARRVPSPAPFTQAKYHEYESDMIGVCLSGQTRGVESWLRTYNHGNPQSYPTNNELREGLHRMRWSDCPVGGSELRPNIPPLLRRREAQK